MTAPILTEEQIREAAVDRYRSDAYCREGREDGFIAGARFALAAAAEREGKLVEALEAMIIMFDDKSRTRRFDETLSVRDNYRKANLLARAALALVKP